MTIRQEASKRLGENLHKVVQVARMTYNRQSPFYRHCTALNQHIDRMVNHFFQGFYQEVEAERSAEKIIATPDMSFEMALKFHAA